MEQTEAHLLDFSKEFDIDLLDQIVAIAYDGAHPNRSAANDFLVKMKEHPEMWRRADAILEGSKQATSRYFGLQVLDSAISTRWKILPGEQREGIRNYVISKIISLSSSGDAMNDEQKSFLSKLNLVLVAILKHDWPHNWPSFVGDIVGSSKNV